MAKSMNFVHDLVTLLHKWISVITIRIEDIGVYVYFVHGVECNKSNRTMFS